MSGSAELEIRSITSPDVHLESWDAKAGEPFRFLVEIEVGLRGDMRADLFYIVVVNPQSLTQASGEFILAERNTMVVSEYNWPRIYKSIEGIIKRCSGDGWNDSVLKLQRYFRWEYEDYAAES